MPIMQNHSSRIMLQLLPGSLYDSQLEAIAHELAHLLIACVDQGASVSFMHPLPMEKAHDFWQSVLQSMQRGERYVWLAHDADQKLVGTVQLITDLPDNQPHRGDVAKMLVHPSARRQGIGIQLMQAMEAHAIALGKTLLVLDTVTQSAGWHLYQQCGWQIAGDIPNFALLPQGGLVSTTYMYKSLD